MTPSGIRLLVLALLLTSCAESPRDAQQSAEASLPEGHPALAEPDPDARSIEGEVLETMDAGGYTYARVQTGEAEVWVAAPLATLEVGRVATVYGAIPMRSFSSASLNRTFDEIYFAGEFVDPTPPSGSVRGTARQVLTAPGYTYVETERDGEVLWIAAPETAVSEGDVVVWVGGTPMGRFTSTSLGRTFEDVLFVEQLWIERR